MDGLMDGQMNKINFNIPSPSDEDNKTKPMSSKCNYCEAVCRMPSLYGEEAKFNLVGPSISLNEDAIYSVQEIIPSQLQ